MKGLDWIWIHLTITNGFLNFVFGVEGVENPALIRVEAGNTTLKGIVVNGSYYAFRGIPYALPPIGQLRFKDPILRPLEEGVEIDGTQYGSICAQWSRRAQGVTLIGSEDCLYLNIFTRYSPGKSLAPTIVYIHGGGFLYASGNVVGPRFFIEQSVVFVTLNYRLGVFGFLSTGDEEIAGNFGFLDQVVALEWIQKYIHHFGGDPNRVTILGHSAGGASVHLLTLSPRAEGTFQRAIMISGNGLCDWAIEKKPLDYAQQIGKLVHCPTDGTKELAGCLRNSSVRLLVKAQEDLLDFWVLPVHATGVVDRGWRDAPFLPESPLEIMKGGHYSPVPIIAGVTRDEGFMGYAILHLNVGNEDFRNTSYFINQLIPRILRDSLKIWKNEEELQRASELVRRTYFNHLNMTDDTGFQTAISETTELIGDILFYTCHREMLEQYASKNAKEIYSFVFAHKALESPNIMKKAIESLRRTTGVNHQPLFDFGVSHVEDMFYLFDSVDQVDGNLDQELSAKDRLVSAAYLKSFVSFAETGNPPWRPIRPGTINYFNFTSVEAPMGENFRKRESQFWFHTIPYIQELGADIKSVETQSGLYLLVLIVLAVLVVTFILATIALLIWVWHLRTTGKAVM